MDMKNNYRVTDRTVNRIPVSPILCGNFIELGYGLQAEAMWGEMLFNRSFEPFPQYQGINKDWYDLFYTDENGKHDYERDWRKFDWYHSGYEHNAWFAAPNDAETYRIEDESTFVIETTPYSEAVIRNVEGGVHGTHCMRIVNSGSSRGGMAQRGKVLKAGMTYPFSGYFRRIGDGEITVTVALHRDGEFGKILDSFTFIPGTGYEKQTYTFRSDYSGRAMLAVWVDSGEIECDCFSLMPEDTVSGWRRDVVEAAKEVSPKVIRWPGGCFASFYDWRDAIGPRDQRKPTASYFWGGYQSNDVGSVELASFCEAVGAEQMICVNLFHPAKENYLKNDNNDYCFPGFTDIREGAKLAADWVAYMNADESHPMGALRASHGRKKPFGVKYWEIDNETCRWFTGEQYAEAVKIYSEAMKAVDPTIRIGMITYAFGGNDVIERMLEIAGEHIDFFADRGPDTRNLSGKLGVMRAYNEKHGTSIGYCNTEWLPYDMFCFHVDSFNWVNGNKSFMFSKWRYAMNIFRQVMMWQREGGDVLFVNFNNFANTHAQNVMDTPKEGVYISAAGRAMGLMASSPAAWVLEIEDYTPELLSTFQVQAAWDREHEKLVLYVFNLDEESREAVFDLSQLKTAFADAEVTAVYADNLYDMNTQKDPDRIRRMTYTAKTDGDTVAVRVPGYGFAMAILEK